MGFSVFGPSWGTRYGRLDGHPRAGVWAPGAVFGNDVGWDLGMIWAPLRWVALPARAASSPEAQELHGGARTGHAGS